MQELTEQNPNTSLTFLSLSPSEDGSFLTAKPVKNKNSEFNMKDATPEDLEGFKLSDEQEWKSICEFGAVQIVNEKEADNIRNNQPHRIVASRMVRRKKPMPGIGNFKFKSRWCVLGHGDPDVGQFKTFSPMPRTEAIACFFSLLCVLAFRCFLQM